MRQIQAEDRALQRVERLAQELRERKLARSSSLHRARWRELLAAAIETAHRYDLGHEALCRYAALVIRFDEDLGRGPAAVWSGPIFEDPWLSDAEKLEQLEQCAADSKLACP
ncbi:MAG: hypothetical protein AAF799_20240 [Myxococcota bacterium]